MGFCLADILINEELKKIADEYDLSIIRVKTGGIQTYFIKDGEKQKKGCD